MKKQEKTLEVQTKKTTIKVDERTKGMLDGVSAGKETYDETIRRLVGVFNNLSVESPLYQKSGNVSGVKYERAQRTFSIMTSSGRFSVVCAFNDLRALSSARQNRAISAVFAGSDVLDWEVDLQVLNIRLEQQYSTIYSLDRYSSVGGWVGPETFAKSNERTVLLLYFKALSEILKETFFVFLHEFILDSDYFSRDNWMKIYKQNNLSMESFRVDVEKKLRDADKFTF